MPQGHTESPRYFFKFLNLICNMYDSFHEPALTQYVDDLLLRSLSYDPLIKQAAKKGHEVSKDKNATLLAGSSVMCQDCSKILTIFLPHKSTSQKTNN